MANPGFSFGGGGTGGFSFQPPKTTAPVAGGSSLGFSATTSTGGFSFAPSVTSSAVPFSFSTPASTAAGTSGSGGFTLTGAATTSAPPQVATTSSAFSFSSPASTSASGGGLLTGGFNFTNPGSSSSSPFNFQGKPSLGLGGATTIDTAKPATPATSQPTLTFSTKPSTGGSLLGAPTSSLLGTTGGSLLGAPPAATTTTGLSLFSAPSTTPVSTTSVLGQTLSSAPSTTSAAPAGLGTGMFSSVAASAAPATPATTATAPPLLGTAVTSGSGAPTLSLTPASTPSLATLTTATTTTSAQGAGATTGAPVTLSVSALEEKVNKWVAEMKDQEDRLMVQAAHVNAWDQLLQQGHDQVQQLRDSLNKVKTDQTKLQAELDFIQGQQQELEQLIEPLESAVSTTAPAQHQGDRQRENMHLIAQNLDSQLRQMTDDLCKVIEHLNTNNSGTQATDPVHTVARVLSAHMDTLKWVDQNSALLTHKIDDLSRIADSKRRD